MRGAREYSDLFKTGQYGKLYITVGSHARGSTFHIQVLPAGEKAIPNGKGNLCTNKNAVEVYGVEGGNPGWTESYGWLHRGKWIEDFEKLVEQKKAEREEKHGTEKKKVKTKEEREAARVERLLANYEK